MSILKTLGLSILVVLAPIQSVMMTALILVMADLITGIAAARTKKQKITSSGFRRTITKLLIYQIVIVLGFLTETYLTGSLVPLSKIISTLIGLTEMKSLVENLNDISGGSLLKSLVKKLNSVKEPS